MPVGFYTPSVLARPVNTYGLDHNCYYVTVAALLGTTVDDLIRATETMQSITGSHEDIHGLFSDVGVTVQSKQCFALQALYHDLLSLPPGASVGLAYRRQGAAVGHMLVVQRDPSFNPWGPAAGLKVIDYQTTPPTVTSFPPAPDMTHASVYYRP